HHGVARGRFAAHVGDGAGDEDGVDPALAQDFGKVRGALNERAETVFLDDEILRAYLERGPELMSLVARGERLHALGTMLRRYHVEIGRPSPQCILSEGGFDPDHGSPGLTHGARETIEMGTIFSAVGQSACATPGSMNAFCMSTTTRAVLAGSRSAWMCSRPRRSMTRATTDCGMDRLCIDGSPS